MKEDKMEKTEKEKALEIAALMEDGKGQDVTVIDVSKLNSSMASQLGLVGDLDSFSVVYTIDKDGYCTSMEQTGTATKDGVQSKVDYLMTVSHMNDIASVSKPQVQESADK